VLLLLIDQVPIEGMGGAKKEERRKEASPKEEEKDMLR
jgi:hypothetical protein